jgi:hypothetical protein
VAAAEPLAHQPRQLMARLVATGLLGALGFVGQLINSLRFYGPAYGDRIGFGGLGWLATCCLAAVIVRSDWRGLLSAWVGALVVVVLTAPVRCPTFSPGACSAFTIGINFLGFAVIVGGFLLLACGATRLVDAIASPTAAHRILGGALVVLIVATVALLALPPGPYTGPLPAPPPPSGFYGP